jgi:cytochrome c553
MTTQFDLFRRGAHAPWRIAMAVAFASVALPIRATAMDTGQALAASCTSCHGGQGGIVPLAGVSQQSIVQSMREFSGGQRSGTVMPQLAKGYSDTQVERLSAWFAAQPNSRSESPR